MTTNSSAAQRQCKRRDFGSFGQMLLLPLTSCSSPLRFDLFCCRQRGRDAVWARNEWGPLVEGQHRPTLIQHRVCGGLVIANQSGHRPNAPFDPRPRQILRPSIRLHFANHSPYFGVRCCPFYAFHVRIPSLQHSKNVISSICFRSRTSKQNGQCNHR